MAGTAPGSRRARAALLAALMLLGASVPNGSALPRQDPAPKQDPAPPVPPAQEGAPLQQPAPQAATKPVQPPPLQQPAREVPIVRSIVVEGAQRYSKTGLIDALGQKLGEPRDRAEIDRGLQRLWTSFHVRATVSERPVEGGVELLLTVVEMPSDLEPRFIGNSEVDIDTLKKWSGLEETSELFLYQTAKVKQRLLEGYHREGFYFAEVDIVSRGGEQDSQTEYADVIFEIREGPKVRVKDIVIEGDESLPERGFAFWKDGLTALAKTELDGPGLFNWWGDVYVEEVLEADLLAMREVYRDRGFLDAVVEMEEPEFSPERDGVRIHIRIDEGERYQVSSVSVKGYEWVDPGNPNSEELKPTDLFFPEDELLGLLTLQPGVIYDSTRRGTDVGLLRDLYGAAGRISHPSLSRRVNWEFLDPELLFDRANHKVAVTYRIVQGQTIRIHDVLFAGTHHTRDKVMRREVSVFPGQIANMVEIQKSLVRIQSTGYFSDQYDVANHREPTFRFRPVEGDPQSWDLEYVVEEGRVVDFNVSGGFDTDSGLFGIISLTMKNFDASDLPSSFFGTFGEVYRKEAFHGGGQRLDLAISPGTQLSTLRIHFSDPDIFDMYEDPVMFDLDLTKNLRSYDYYDENRFAATVRFRRSLSREVSVGAGVQLGNVNVSDLDVPVPPQLLQEDQEGTLNLRSVLFDASWRHLDAPNTPREGFRMNVIGQVYGEVLGGDAAWAQMIYNADAWIPLSDPTEGPVNAMHFGFDVGVAQPYGGTDAVPYTERFFLGGAKTLRGFAYRGVGPMYPPSDDPYGGETSFSGTIEYQHPLYVTTQPGTYRKIEMLRGIIFCDVGELDTDPFRMDLSQVRLTVGFGVGLAYPLPVTISFGWPLLDEPGDQTQVFAFSIGL